MILFGLVALFVVWVVDFWRFMITYGLLDVFKAVYVIRLVVFLSLFARNWFLNAVWLLVNSVVLMVISLLVVYLIIIDCICLVCWVVLFDYCLLFVLGRWFCVGLIVVCCACLVWDLGFVFLFRLIACLLFVIECFNSVVGVYFLVWFGFNCSLFCVVVLNLLSLVGGLLFNIVLVLVLLFWCLFIVLVWLMFAIVVVLVWVLIVSLFVWLIWCCTYLLDCDSIWFVRVGMGIWLSCVFVVLVVIVVDWLFGVWLYCWFVFV